MTTISATGVQYVRVPVAANLRSAGVDITGDSVYLAFQATDTPVGATWVAAAWETLCGRHYARVLVGTGGTVVAAGSYFVWVKVTGNPETYIASAGPLTVTA